MFVNVLQNLTKNLLSNTGSTPQYSKATCSLLTNKSFHLCNSHTLPSLEWFATKKKANTNLVRRNGIIIPAPVATRSKTTWRTVSTTFMSFTTKALALELSKPSSVTYCCCCRAWCSIFWICKRSSTKISSIEKIVYKKFCLSQLFFFVLA